MTGRIFTKILRYFGIWKPKWRYDGSGGPEMSVAEYESINPLSDAQVADFLECLKRESALHPILLTSISPPVDPSNAAEEGEEIAYLMNGFVTRYMVKNGLRMKGLGLAEIGMGQLQRAAYEWAKENLPNTEGATR